MLLKFVVIIGITVVILVAIICAVDIMLVANKREDQNEEL